MHPRVFLCAHPGCLQPNHQTRPHPAGAQRICCHVSGVLPQGARCTRRSKSVNRGSERRLFNKGSLLREASC